MRVGLRSRVILLRDRRGRNRLSRRARWDSSCSAGRGGCISRGTSSEIWPISSLVGEFVLPIVMAVIANPLRAHLSRACSATAADCPASTNALRVFDRRFRQNSVAEIQDVAHAARFFDGFAGGARRRLQPAEQNRRDRHFLAAPPGGRDSRRASARSVFQSTLRTSAPDFARLSRCVRRAFCEENLRHAAVAKCLEDHLRGGQFELVVFAADSVRRPRCRRVARRRLPPRFAISDTRPSRARFVRASRGRAAARSRSICFACEISPRVRPSIM